MKNHTSQRVIEEDKHSLGNGLPFFSQTAVPSVTTMSKSDRSRSTACCRKSRQQYIPEPSVPSRLNSRIDLKRKECFFGLHCHRESAGDHSQLSSKCRRQRYDEPQLNFMLLRTCMHGHHALPRFVNFQISKRVNQVTAVICTLTSRK